MSKVIGDNWPNGELRGVRFGPLVNSGSQSNFSGHMSTQPTAAPATVTPMMQQYLRFI
ncbi:hypothetical protein KDW49_11635 [Burkholderia dolosa]|uniref:hypothetical protein n=1 Tax=Burkholderia dolosa TaxID=152500 RepID=UPI001BA3CB31|nr:hypothetical protein [Burkholderia dolosa]MBR8301362.1 hypothetical protein [Burkholderia dolosa]